MIPEVGLHTMGIELWDVSARVLTGDRIPACASDTSDYLGFVNLPSVAGQVNTVDVNVFMRMPGVIGVVERCPVGEVMRDMTRAVGFGMGYVMARAETWTELADLLDTIVELVQTAHHNHTEVGL